MIYEELEARLTQWAQTQTAVRAVIVVGSRARGDQDAWSDLDVLIFTTERARYAADAEWMRSFGDVWLTYIDNTGRGDPEWFALYEGGLKFDAVLLQVEDAALDLESLMTLYPYQGVFGRGVKVLFDRKGSPRLIAPQAPTLPTPPSGSEFEHLINGFLLESVTTAKFIGRGDFWRAQHWFAHDLRPCLLTLIEWHAHGRDTWYNGRFMQQWADPRILEVLPQAFPSFDRESLIISLRAALGLFRLLGEETAARWGYTYPTAAHTKIATLIESILTE
jgi:aminoglycoside 6-adenylyltransferase